MGNKHFFGETVIGLLNRKTGASLSPGQTPRTWRKGRVVFIPNSDKQSYILARKFDPISLTSLALETVERFVNIYICSSVPDGTIHGAGAEYRGVPTGTLVGLEVSI